MNGGRDEEEAPPIYIRGVRGSTLSLYHQHHHHTGYTHALPPPPIVCTNTSPRSSCLATPNHINFPSRILENSTTTTTTTSQYQGLSKIQYHKQKQHM
ncbi:hypothetical protein E2C01_022377 [Portunus trituberculatus]|uniref:Uncharacterized protein n=1 Tax=Portunus trituberculatus TaxID=210409 RepID=A0A5B7E748_PORTR|nr:hypothetical protein [Portunus trituberculatus]